MTILVTGGAGYIGSHCVRQLIEAGQKVCVIDNLYRGHREAVPAEASFFQIDLLETERLTEVMKSQRIEKVIHFAALAYVGESVTEPLPYYMNNTAGTVSLLRAMRNSRVSQIVFSSSCATYGIPDQIPVTEESPQSPINPYGWSKLFIEQILNDCSHSYPNFGFIGLRYFNVAGCSHDGALGEDHDPETHLIPNCLRTALGQQSHMTVLGNDYPTDDGTCIRDYVHVEDICSAHLLALNALNPQSSRYYNIGLGQGFSVLDVVKTSERVTGHEIPVEFKPRRPGDPPVLSASNKRISEELGWSPKYTSLEEIIQTAWDWFRTHPEGYRTETAS
ncbi:UDP-glucose 4-epimerase [Gimesia panareensis]|uniref:UDP-glucose 4-epimerase n=1 Tax=Gimesia panareensis TaxID=2527978 RepID=A0A517Q4W6_9PLAN|nr:UDP-glucose 4-epimerase GalE [Gimesia panareensis]QDT26666.1 UDP-glucose 4-epimerase [Gimesia panareensis]